jgi:glycerol-3-phosphate acyltransferase PlsX
MSTKDKVITIALDVMGADVEPASIIKGGLMAAQDLGKSGKLILVGKSEIIDNFIKTRKNPPSNVSIKNAPHAVAMSDVATEGIRKKTSSIAISLSMQKKGEADAFVSAGNTGAVMASSLLILGRVEGIARPAIVTFFPTAKGIPTLVLDVGANIVCKPIHLYQFGLMGSVYASLMYGRTSPKLGLLTIGEERSKGNELIMQTRELFEKSELNFVGHLEGRDILSGVVDVVVCDGFVGNVILKFAESIEGFLTTSLKRQIETNIFSRAGAALMSPFLRRLRKTFDYAEYGGAPLLGINGVSMICHGRSSPRAIKNAILSAADMVRHNISENIREELVLNNGKNNARNSKQPNNGDRLIRSATSFNE